MQSLKSLIKSILPKPESSSLAMILYKGYGFISRKKMTKAELENDRASYIAQNTDTRFAISREFDYICRADKYANNGAGIESNSDYFIQDIWGARKVTATNPARHYDVGSSVAGFIAHLLGANQPTTLIDIRPLPSLNTSFLNLNGGGGLQYLQANATNLEQIADSSLESISALCSIEHFGLGRYGDPIDPMGWEKALLSFERVLKIGGKMYISVPVGQRDKVCFNAHRVYRPQTIIDTLKHCQIREMSYIVGLDTRLCMEYKDGKLHIDEDGLGSIPDMKNWGVTGLFEFEKVGDKKVDSTTAAMDSKS